MSQELIEQQLRRLEGLLHPDRTKGALEKTKPEHDPAELGALEGVGYRSSDPDVQVSVYIFPNWNKHNAVSKQLKDEYTDDKGVHVVTATNGPMLLFGHTRVDGKKGANAKFRLGDIVSAFAGDE